MKVGFTGTQRGMTERQMQEVRRLLRELRPTEVHAGDCVGADLEFAVLASEMGIPVVGHPPADPKKRAFFAGYSKTEDPLPYMARNGGIVDAVDVLIACPKEEEEVLFSGTWATVRRGRKKSRCRVIVLPPF